MDPLSDVLYLDGVAALDEAGDLLVFLINRHNTSAAQVSLELESYGKARMFTHTEIASPHAWDLNEWGSETIAPVVRELSPQQNCVELKPHSVNLVRICLQ